MMTPVFRREPVVERQGNHADSHFRRVICWMIGRRAVRLLAMLSLAGMTLQGTESGGEGGGEGGGGTEAEWTPGSLARSFTVLPGFHIDGVYRVPADQGSWVAMTVDPKGRLICSDQHGHLYRVTLPQTNEPPRVEPLGVELGNAQGLVHAFDSLYVVVNRRRGGPGQPGSALYRARDTTGDDQYDRVELLREFDGDGEHGPHGIVAGADGRSLFLVAGNATGLPDPEQSRVPRAWQEDELLPRLGQTDGLFLRNRPGGWVCRTDPDGKTFELIAIGLRNPYDLAFNAEGELFTFDSDMEWDAGTPWYRPTRVLHITSGADFGWRTGSNKWPDNWIDTLPSVVDVGLSSPTGIAFGHGARFPARYQRALYLADWSYGRIYALHLEPRGASYTGKLEQFLAGAPMAITALLIHPRDGAMYFIVGGRGTSSALYRVSYRGRDSVTRVSPRMPVGGAARAERHRLESFHGRVDADAVVVTWPYLDHPDRHLRYAARVALEHQPVAAWQEAALLEPRPRLRIAALTALARRGEPRHQALVFEALGQIPSGPLTMSDRVDLVRAHTLACLRLGPVTPAVRAATLRHLDGLYPASSFALNRDLCALLVHLRAPGVVGRTLDLLGRSAALEEQLHYVLCLRTLDASDWSMREHEKYFDWLNRTAASPAGVSFVDYLRQIRSDAVARLTPATREALGKRLQEPVPVDPLAELRARPFVKAWTVRDLHSAAGVSQQGRDLERGRRVYAEALCSRCHRFDGVGGITGPDLTGLGRRFDTRTLLESILEPSKVVSDQYTTVELITKDGDSHIGRISDMNEESVLLLTDLITPAAFKRIPHDQIADVVPSPLSMMPTGLLDHFTLEEILDLIAYMRTPRIGD
jgi:putative heme-binding domain-containing protein